MNGCRVVALIGFAPLARSTDMLSSSYIVSVITSLARFITPMTVRYVSTDETPDAVNSEKQTLRDRYEERKLNLGLVALSRPQAIDWRRSEDQGR